MHLFRDGFCMPFWTTLVSLICLFSVSFVFLLVTPIGFASGTFIFILNRLLKSINVSNTLVLVPNPLQSSMTLMLLGSNLNLE